RSETREEVGIRNEEQLPLVYQKQARLASPFEGFRSLVSRWLVATGYSAIPPTWDGRKLPPQGPSPARGPSSRPPASTSARLPRSSEWRSRESVWYQGPLPPS